jgi:hypothetical protein
MPDINREDKTEFQDILADPSAQQARTIVPEPL